MFQTKVVEDIKRFMFNNFFSPEYRALRQIVGKLVHHGTTEQVQS